MKIFLISSILFSSFFFYLPIAEGSDKAKSKIDCDFTQKRLCSWHFLANKAPFSLTKSGLKSIPKKWTYLFSTNFEKTTGTCLEIGYLAKNNHYILDIVEQVKLHGDRLLINFNKKGNGIIRVDLDNIYDFHLKIQVYDFGDASITLKNVKISPGSCYAKDASVDCIFESNFCSWRYKKGSKLKLDNGAVIYPSETSQELYSQTLMPTTSSCLRVNFETSKSGSLTVFLKDVDDTKLNEHGGESKKDSLHYWQLSSYKPFQIFMVGKDVKVHSVKLDNSSCPDEFDKFGYGCDFTKNSLCAWKDPHNTHKFTPNGITAKITDSTLKLLSPIIRSDENHCFTITFRKMPNSESIINVCKHEKSNIKKSCKKIKVSKSSQYTYQFNSSKGIQLEIDVEKSSMPIIEVDINLGVCSDKVSCIFKNTTCTWTMKNKNDFTLDEQGLHTQPFSWTSISSLYIRKTNKKCFIMDYKLNSGTIEVNIGANPNQLFMLQSFSDRGESKARIDISSYQDFRIYIRLFHFMVAHSEVTLKSVLLEDGPCYQNDESIDCDFKNTFCQWIVKPYKADELKLTKKSVIIKKKDVITLTSRLMQPTSGSCLSVKFKYLDEKDNQLSIRIEDFNGEIIHLFNHLYSKHSTDFLPLSSNYPFKITISGRNVEIFNVKFKNSTCKYIYKTDDCNFYEGSTCRWKSKDKFSYTFQKLGIRNEWGSDFNLTSSLMTGGKKQCMYIDQQNSIYGSSYLEVYTVDLNQKNWKLVRNISTIHPGIIPVNLDEKNDYKVMLKTSLSWYIIRSIQFKPGDCTKSVDCKFHNATCNWSFDSERTKSMIKSSSGLMGIKGVYSYLYSPILPKTAGRCLHIQYSFTDAYMNVKMEIAGKKSIILSKLLAKNTKELIPIEYIDDYQILLEASVSKSTAAKAILKNVVLDPKPCLNQNVSLNCDFNGKFCNWLHDLTTKSKLLLKTDLVVFPSDEMATLYSRMQKPTASSCLFLKFSFNLQDSGKLLVYTKNMNGSTNQALFKKSSSNEDNHKIPISSKYPFQIFIEAKGINLDSVRFKNVPCVDKFEKYGYRCDFTQGSSCAWSSTNAIYDKNGVRNKMFQKLKLLSHVIKSKSSQCLTVSVGLAKSASVLLVNTKDLESNKMTRVNKFTNPKVGNHTVTIEVDSPYQIEISSSPMAVGIKFVNLVPGKCLTPGIDGGLTKDSKGNCDFTQKKLCSWHFLANKAPFSLTKSGLKSIPKKWTYLFSTNFEKTTGTCLEIGYLAKNNHYILDIVEQVKLHGDRLLINFNKKGNGIIRVDLDNIYDFHLKIQVFDFGDASITLKNVKISPGSCYGKDASVDCNFESNFCSWRYKKGSKLKTKNGTVIYPSDTSQELYSQTLMPTTSSCLRVNFETSKSGSLTVFLKDVDDAKWNVYGGKSKKDSLHYWQLSSYKPFQIFMVGKDVKVHSVKLDNSSCPDEFDKFGYGCDFTKNSLCAWKDPHNTHKFTKTGIVATGSENDLRLISPIIRSNEDYCMTIKLSKFKGSIDGNIVIYKIEKSSQGKVFFEQIHEMKLEKNSQYTFQFENLTGHQLVIEMQNSLTPISEVGINLGICSDKVSCVFNKTICSWSMITKDEFNLDENGLHTKSGSTGLIVSPYIKKAQSDCFFLELYLSSGTVEISIGIHPNQLFPMDLYVLNGDSNYGIDISALQDFKIYIKTIHSKNPKSEVTLKSVSLKDGSCYKHDSRMDCDFKSTLCLWKIEPVDRRGFNYKPDSVVFYDLHVVSLISKLLYPTSGSCLSVNFKPSKEKNYKLSIRIEDVYGQVINLFNHISSKYSTDFLPLSSNQPFKIIISGTNVEIYKTTLTKSTCEHIYKTDDCNFYEGSTCRWNSSDDNSFTFQKLGIRNEWGSDFKLTSHSITGGKKQCMYINQLTSTNKDSYLEVYTKGLKNNSMTIIRNISTIYPGTIPVDLDEKNNYQVVLKTSPSWYIIRSVEFQPGDCAKAVDCIFDNTTCNWNFDDGRKKGMIKSESGLMGMEGVYSYLYSPILPKTSGRCLHIYYSFIDAFMNVKMKIKGQKSITLTKLTSGNTTKDIPIEYIDDYQIEFETYVRRSAGAEALLRNVVLDQKPCFSEDISINCEFKGTFCNWLHDLKTKSNLILETDSVIFKSDEMVTIHSRMLQPTMSLCLSLKFSYLSNTQGKINIYMKDLNGETSALFGKFNDKENIDKVLVSSNHPFQIFIEAMNIRLYSALFKNNSCIDVFEKYGYRCDFTQGSLCAWSSTNENYISFDENGVKNKMFRKLMLLSHVIKSKSSQCLTVSVGSVKTASTLFVYIKDSKSSKLSLVKKFLNLKVGTYTMTVEADSPYQIEISSTILALGIKSVNLIPGKCFASAKFCNFDESDCQFNLKQSQWKRGIAKEISIGDHGSDNDGKYLFVTSSKSSLIFSKSYDAKPNSCIRFYFLTKNNNSITVGYETKGSFQNVGKDLRSHGSDWASFEFVVPNSKFKIGFTSSGSGEGGVAIDDVKIIESNTCKGSCSFNKDACSWQNDDIHSGWEVMNAKSHTAFNRPSKDASKSSQGGYLGLRFKNTQQAGVKSRIISMLFLKQSKPQGMVFNYHMDQDYVGTLNIYQREYMLNDEIVETLLWSLHGNQGPDWKIGMLPFANNNPSVIVIEGIYGMNSEASIYIDEIIFLGGSVTLSPTKALPKVEILTTLPTTTTVEPIKTYGKCDFNSSFCNWKPKKLKSPLQSWKVWTPNTKDQYLPLNGHNNVKGFAYIHFNGPQKEDAELVLKNVRGVNCIKYWFYYRPGSEPTLKIIQKNIHYTPKPSYGYTWFFHEFTIGTPSDKSFEVTIAATSDQQGIVALDDVVITKGNCKYKPGSCNFETDECEWQMIGPKNQTWEVQSGLTNKHKGPVEDHTYGLITGHYASVTPNVPPGSLVEYSSQSFKISNQQPYGKFCLEFYFHMFGSDFGTLKVKYKLPRSIFTLWLVRNYDTQGKWMRGTVPISSFKEFKLQFDVLRGKGKYGDISIDDIVLQQEKCQLNPPIANPANAISDILNCNFEHGNFCKWKSDNYRIDWKFAKTSKYAVMGSTQKHSSKTGVYTFFKPPRDEKSTTYKSLTSPIFSNPYKKQGLCLSFYYYLFGDKVDHSQISMMLIAMKSNNETLGSSHQFGINSKFIDRWYKHFYHIKSNFRTDIKISFSFELNAGNDELAIDDIAVTVGKCEQTDGCNFEDDDCRWYGIRRERRSFNQKQNVPIDHTTNSRNGYMKFAEPKKNGNLILFKDFPRGFSGTKCFSFWFMNTGKFSHLSLKIREISNPYRNLWSWKHQTKNSWHYGSVNIQSSQRFTLKFQAESNKAIADGFVALDDFKFSNGACKPMYDFCDFSLSFCGFTNSLNNKFNWLVGHGKVSKNGVVNYPILDHTYKSARQTFAYVDLTDEKVLKNEYITLASSILTSASTVCIEFYYICLGTDLPKLQLTVFSEDLTNPFNTIWTSRSSEVKTWTYQKVKYSKMHKFQLLFQAAKQSGSKAFIAIDDISINLNCIETTTIPIITAKPIVKEINCNFTEGDSCIFNSKISNWKNAKAPIKDNRLQPTVDAEYLENGRFMISEFGSDDSTVLQVKNKFEANQRLCLSFWHYFVSLRSDSELSLQIVYDDKTEGSTIWQPQRPLLDDWRKSNFSVIPLKNKPYYLRFLLLGGKEKSDSVAALDDFSLTYDECHASEQYSVNCDFDNGMMCGYEQDFEYNWNVGRPVDQFDELLDHTTSSSSGSFLYFYTNQSKMSVSKLESQPLEPTNGICLKFWYMLPTTDIYELSVHLSSDGISRDILWQSQSSNVKVWLPAQMLVSSSSKFKILFQVRNLITITQKISSSNIVAIDDISFSDWTCSEPVSCYFINGFCNWLSAIPPSYNRNFLLTNSLTKPGPSISSLLTSDSQWIRLSGNHINNIMKKDNIETSFNIYKNYILFYPKRMGSKAILLSEMITAVQNGCLSFVGYGNGMKTISLDLYVLVDNVAKLVKNAMEMKYTGDSVEIGVDLTSNDLSTSTNKKVQILLVFKSWSKSPNSIVISSIGWSNEKCPTDERFQCADQQRLIDRKLVCNWKKDCEDSSDEKFCGDCAKFNNGFCGWTSHGSSTPYVNTGGERLTFYSGKIHFVSPLLQPAKESCKLVFNYYISNSAALNDFYVAIRYQPHGINITTKVWKSFEASVNSVLSGFKSGSAHIGHVDSEFQIVFGGVTYNEGSTIFDFKMIDCYPSIKSECDKNSFQCKKSMECVSKDKLCDYSYDCLDGSDEISCDGKNSMDCNFEHSKCMWHKDSSQDNWQLITPSTNGIDRKLPQRDHTTRLPTGHYMQSTDSMSSLAGPIFEPSVACKMHFYYSKSNVNYKVEQLVVATRTRSNSRLKEVWHSDLYNENDHSTLFFIRDTVIFNEIEPFQVVIVSHLEKGSTIAVDDISFNSDCKLHKEPLKPTDKPPVVPGLRCKSTEFKCLKPEKCIPLEQKCNFISDCMDASDEKNCGSCDFENGLCGWVPQMESSNYNFKWLLMEASGAKYPKTDSTTLSSGGHYLGGISLKTSSSRNAKIVIHSPEIGPTGPNCMMLFDYNFESDLDSSIIVNVKEINPMISIISTNIFSNSERQWKKGEVKLKNLPERIQVSIIGKYKNGIKIAIDDIRFSGCDQNETEVVGLSCTFENGYCGWNVFKSDGRHRWERQYPTSDLYGPQYDYKHEKSYYLYLNSLKAKPIDKAYITSELIPKQTKHHCFTFWYYMFGEHVDKLSVSKLFNGKEELFKRSGSLGNQWIKGLLEIPPSSDSFKIQFEGDYKEFSRGGIAIDDVKYEDGFCPQKDGFSDFQGKVSWTDSKSKWQVTNGKSNTLIKKDYTYDNDIGKFAMLSTVGTFSLKSPLMTVQNKQSCFSFWIYQTSKHNAIQVKIVVSHKRYAHTIEIYNNLNSHPNLNTWYHVQKTLSLEEYLKDSFQITIEGIVSAKDSAIAVDNLFISPVECPKKGNCNFEVDTCGWNIKESSNYARWLRMSSHIPTKYDRPSKDVTTDSADGWYLLVEAQKQDIGKMAVFESEYFKPTKQICVSFYYMISDDDIGVLKLELKLNGRSHDVYTKNDKTNGWKKFVESLDSKNYDYLSQSNFMFQFLASIKKEGGYIAIDEIKFQDQCYNKITTPIPTTVKPAGNQYCDFESTCNWKWSSNWRIVKPKPSCGYLCPQNDQTLHSSNGHYLTVSDRKTSGPYSTIKPLSLPDHKDGFCLKFWYYMYAVDDQTTIFVSYEDSKYDSPMLGWEIYGRQDLVWKFAHIYLSGTEKITGIQILAHISNEFLEQISIDELSLSSGHCAVQGQFFCSFETFYPNINFGNNAKIGDMGQLGLPGGDHTIGTKFGAVAAFIGPFKSQLISINKISKGLKCTQFWYRFFGEDTNNYIMGGSAYSITLNFPKPQTFKDVKERKWIFGQFSSYGNREHYIIIEGYRGDTDSAIAVDDIEIRNGECQPIGNCNFEAGNKCGWTNDLSFNMRWFVASPTQLKTKKLPPTDMTENSTYGHFLIVDPEHHSSSYGKAMLVSPFFDDEKFYKIRFYYFFNGGVLKVSVRNINESRKIWKAVYKKTDTWKPFEYKLKKKENFEFVIEAFVSYKEEFMAIDEIQIESQFSPFEDVDDTFDCHDGIQNALPMIKVCDFIDDCSDRRDETVCGTCDFEIDSCGWSIEGSYGNVYRTSKNSTLTSKHPEFDHSLGPKSNKGHYMMFAEMKGPQLKYIIGPTLMMKKSSPTCQMTVWMAVDNSSSFFSISVVRDGSEGIRYRNNALTGEKSIWSKYTIDIGQIYSDFQVRITPFPSDYMAIDDVKFENCRYPMGNKASCSSGQFMCKNTGICIDQSAVCDTINDCLDFSDERKCNPKHMCTLQDDNSGCSWTPTSENGAFKWIVANENMESESGPATDHTIGLHEEGSFYQTSASLEKSKGLSAYLNSDLITVAKGKKCQLRFFYYMFGKDVGSLQVETKPLSSRTWENKWKMDGDKGQKWMKGIVDFPKDGASGQFRFRAMSGKSKFDIIAIDDITFSESCVISKFDYHRFMCKAGAPIYIDENTVCDFKSDCSDRSDESNCPSKCNFGDNSMCGWTSSSNNSIQIVNSTLVFKRTDEGDIKPLSIVSPIFRNSSSNCILKFRFFTIGYPITVALVYQDEHMSAKDRHMQIGHIGFDDNNVKDDWQEAKIGIGRRNARFSIEISSREILPLSIDDISFENCGLPKKDVSFCPKNKFKCKKTGACINGSLRCDFNDDCGDNSDEATCNSYVSIKENFENEKIPIFYQPNHYMLDTANWIRGTADDGSSPAYDHTRLNRKGHFMMTDFKFSGEQNQEAWLITKNVFKTIKPKSTCRMTFYYSMYDINVKKLAIYAQYFEAETHLEEKWSDGGYKGMMWIRKQIALDESRPFKIVFVASATNGYNGQIAIDDITFTSGCIIDGKKLPMIPTTTQTTTKGSTMTTTHTRNSQTSHKSTESVKTTKHVTLFPGPVFQCLDKKKTVIRAAYRCDGVPDCPNSNDERLNCPATKCSQQEFYCKDGIHGKCIAKNKLCDGNYDCSDQSDESLCNSCPKDFCKNGAKCSIVDQFPTCSCKARFMGYRCYGLYKSTTKHITTTDTQTTPKITQTSTVKSHSAATTNPFMKSTQSHKSTESVKTTNHVTLFPGPVFHCLDKKKTVIRAAYRCDGVPDCPNSNDERLNCPVTKCSQQEFYCKDGIHGKCIAKNKLCDGIYDCSDQSDESLCNGCPKDFCKNGAKCSIVDRFPTCSCKAGFMGYRCYGLYKPMLTSTENLQLVTVSADASAEGMKVSPHKLGEGSIAGIVIGVMVVIAFIAFLAYLFKKNRYGRTNDIRNPLVRNMENPIYESNMIDDADFKITAVEEIDHFKSKKKRALKDDDNPRSIDNPLYDEFSGLEHDTDA